MNLELLDPFRRQIPDRIDSTLQTPNSMHKTFTQNEMEKDPEWKAAFHLSFNRRGTYLAVGYSTGSVIVHDFISRTTSAVYATDATNEVFVHPATTTSKRKIPKFTYPHGVTSVTWSRRSRTLLVGSVGDATVRLIDCTHPFGPEMATILGAESKKEEDGMTIKHDKKPKEEKGDQTSTAAAAAPEVTAKDNVFKTELHPPHYQRIPLYLTTSANIESSRTCPPIASLITVEEHLQSIQTRKQKELNVELGIPLRFPILVFQLPELLAGSLQVHPRETTAGLAILHDGSLVVFRAPQTVWELYQSVDDTSNVRIATLCKSKGDNNTKMTCAAWSHTGDKIFACTKAGAILGFDVAEFMVYLASTTKCVPEVKPTFRLCMGAMAWHVIVSRNGKYLALNCADAALRLYSTEDLWANDKTQDLKPKYFQDVVSKVPFVCCDFSGDDEYLVGGCNGQHEKYELYLWDTTTGALMDRLTGAQVQLHSISWHPTRSFLAVATSDGLVDIWGPRMDWTAFAPDFQALPMNVEYVEREDEFDLVEELEEDSEEKELEEIVDIVTVDPVPVFASDSESESEAFAFETKIHQVMMATRGRPPLRSEKQSIEDKE